MSFLRVILGWHADEKAMSQCRKNDLHTTKCVAAFVQSVVWDFREKRRDSGRHTRREASQGNRMTAMVSDTVAIALLL